MLSQSPFTLPPPKQFKRFKQFRFKMSDNRREHRAALVPVPNEWITAVRRFVLSVRYKVMLRVCYERESFNDYRRVHSVLPSLKMLRVCQLTFRSSRILRSLGWATSARLAPVAEDPRLGSIGVIELVSIYSLEACSNAALRRPNRPAKPQCD